MNEFPDNKRFDLLAKKLLEDSITAAEIREYLDWLNQPETAEVIIPEAFAASKEMLENRMLNYLQEQLAAEKIALPAKPPMESTIESPSHERSIPFRFKIKYRRWIAAASVLILLSAGLIIWAPFNVPKKQLTNTNRYPVPALKPGTDKAILILADGRKIILDSAQNGMLAQEGGTRILKQSGDQLVYKPGNTQTDISYNTMATPNGGQYRLVLPDGSIVWLNAASSITYPTVFNGRERKVSILGEAYFEISPDREKPFLVDVAGKASIEVLGTHFNVNAYADEQRILTTLLEGRIRLGTKSGQVTLHPGQQASAAISAAISLENNVDTSQVVSWKNGYFQFNRTDLQTVMRQIARWYDVDIKYEGKIPADKFIGRLPRSASGAQVLQALQEMQVHVRIEGKTMIVMP